MFEDETPVAWNGLPRNAIVVAADGAEIGRVIHVLGDEQEDIFHGLAVRRAGDGRTVEIDWPHIKRMTEQHVVTDVAAGEVDSLPAYRER